MRRWVLYRDEVWLKLTQTRSTEVCSGTYRTLSKGFCARFVEPQYMHLVCRRDIFLPHLWHWETRFVLSFPSSVPSRRSISVIFSIRSSSLNWPLSRISSHIAMHVRVRPSSLSSSSFILELAFLACRDADFADDEASDAASAAANQYTPPKPMLMFELLSICPSASATSRSDRIHSTASTPAMSEKTMHAQRTTGRGSFTNLGPSVK